MQQEETRIIICPVECVGNCVLLCQWNHQRPFWNLFYVLYALAYEEIPGQVNADTRCTIIGYRLGGRGGRGRIIRTQNNRLSKLRECHGMGHIIDWRHLLSFPVWKAKLRCILCDRAKVDIIQFWSHNIS